MKSFLAYYLTTVKWSLKLTAEKSLVNIKTLIHIKELIIEEWMSQWRNQERQKKISGTNETWKYNTTKPLRHSESGPVRKNVGSKCLH